jgi:hypothetical protein
MKATLITIVIAAALIGLLWYLAGIPSVVNAFNANSQRQEDPCDEPNTCCQSYYEKTPSGKSYTFNLKKRVVPCGAIVPQ